MKKIIKLMYINEISSHFYFLMKTYHIIDNNIQMTYVYDRITYPSCIYLSQIPNFNNYLCPQIIYNVKCLYKKNYKTVIYNKN